MFKAKNCSYREREKGRGKSLHGYLEQDEALDTCFPLNAYDFSRVKSTRVE